jgi:hypothetical protein
MGRPVLIALTSLLMSSTMTDAQTSTHRVNVRGMHMYYEVSGSGDPLIVLHGAYMNIPSMG